jgi:hypothetical protein
MKMPRSIVGSILAVLLLAIVIGLLGFAHAYSDVTTRCFAHFAQAQWPKWVGCAMAAHQDLAGGLIGLAGALFAAWLAYSGAQDQLHNTNQQLRAMEKLRAQERLNTAVNELKILSDAKEYLDALVSQFPQPSDSNYAAYNFAEQLTQLYQRAHVYVSESAATAPGEFGRRILKETWRIRTLAENVETRIKERKMSFQDLSDEARLALEECRRIMVDLALEIQRRQIQLTNLRDQVSTFS